MMQAKEFDADMLSALADGRLDGDDFLQAVAVATETAEGRATWHAYHVVGDVLRSSELSGGADDGDFVLRLRARLATEAQQAPQLPLQADVPAVVAARNIAGQVPEPAKVANNMRWKMVAGLASVVAVVALGSQWMGSPSVLPMGPQLANSSSSGSGPVEQASVPAVLQTPPPVLAQAAASAAAPVMLRDPRLDELLAAHRQFGGTSALQMPAGFLRNATFERPER